MLLLLAIGPALLPEFSRLEGRTPRHRERRPFARRRAGRHLWPQAHRRRRHRRHRDAVRAAGVALGIAFVRRQARLADPLIDLRLFRIPSFSTALAVNVSDSSRHSRPSCSSRSISSRARPVAATAGLWSLPAALAFIAGSSRRPRSCGASMQRGDRGRHVVTAAGFVILSQASDASSQLATLVAGQIVFSLGTDARRRLITDIVLSSAPPERAARHPRCPKRASNSATLSASRSWAAVTARLSRRIRCRRAGGIPAARSSSALDHRRRRAGRGELQRAVLGCCAWLATRIQKRSRYPRGSALRSR